MFVLTFTNRFRFPVFVIMIILNWVLFIVILLKIFRPLLALMALVTMIRQNVTRSFIPFFRLV